MTEEKVNAPVIIYDWMVHAHHVYEWVRFYQEEITNLPKKSFESIVKAVWAWSLNRGIEFLPEQDYKVIIVKDGKDKSGCYWRKYAGDSDEQLKKAWEEYGTKGSTAYKGHRNSRTEQFWDIEHIGKEYAERNFPCFKKTLFEADDWAGLAYRQWNSTGDREMFLYTVDRDWSMLVNQSRGIYFANSRRPKERELIQERLVDDEGVIFHTEYKLREKISCPRDLAFAKSIKGDMGDNLPPGSPVYLFDLCEPPDEWRMENYDPQLSDIFCSELNHFTVPNTRKDHLEEAWKKHQGVLSFIVWNGGK